MGVAISTNIANQAKQIGISVTNTFTQNCTDKIAQSQDLDVTKCPGLKIKQVNFQQNDYISQACIQNDQTKDQIKQTITTKLNQMANSTNEGLGIGVSDAASIVNSSTNLAEAIANTYTQTCVSQVAQSQKFVCNKSKDVNIGIINFDQGTTSISSCLQKDTSVNAATIQYAQAIGQSAAAKNADSFVIFIVIFFVIIGFIGYVIIQLVKSNTVKWIVVGIVIVLVLFSIAYGFTAYENRSWPFEKTN